MKNRINLNNVTTGITHAGVFHADDVLAAALLTTVNPAMEIKRVRETPDDIEESTTIVFDIGGDYNPLTNAISAFNPNWNESQNFDTAFNKAVEADIQKEFKRKVKSSGMKMNEVLEALMSGYTSGKIQIDKKITYEIRQEK